MSEWRKVRIEEIAEKIAIGPFGSRMKSDTYTETGVPVIRGTNITGGRSFLGDWVYVSEEDADQLANCNVTEGDLVFPHRGAIGEVGIVPGDQNRYMLSTSLMKLRCDPKQANSLYLYYFFKSHEGRHQLLKNASQVGTPGIGQPLSSLKSIELALPPLEDQRAIAHILGILDDKIELNHRMNETLEAMARAIFKSWFVNFVPVRAKASSEPRESICRRLGLTPELLALFPDSFQNSELGEIPEDWRVAIVDEGFDLTMGQSPPGNTYNEVAEGLPFYQGRTDFGFRFPSRRVFCTAPTRLAEAGDTLISVRAPVGDINMADELCCIGRGVAAARHKSGSRSYTYYFMRSIKDVFKQFEAEGTVFGSINKKDFHNVEQITPPRKIIQAFEGLAEPIDSQIATVSQQSRTIVAVRDALLPRLLSGELCVSDVESAMQAAA